MFEYYTHHDKLLISVDCIIFAVDRGELKLLLTRRNFEPEKGRWSLMGGFVRYDESIKHAAVRVLKGLTGLEGIFMQQVGAFGEVDRDPGERVVSVAYYALLNFEEIDHKLIEQHDAVWMDVNNLPELGFDHKEMIERALSEMRRRAMTEPLAINLLPRLFSLTQLQNLYETVLDKKLDKRNFRRRILESGFIEPTDQIDKLSSRRGARLYQISDVYSDKLKEITL